MYGETFYGRHTAQRGKRDKNNLTTISKPHAHPHAMTKTPAKFQDDRYKTVRGVALTVKTPRVNVDGRMDGQTDGNLHAKVVHAK